MENISLTEAVEQLFAQNGVEEIARRIRARGCLAYAPSGESLAQQEVCTFEIKLPVNEPVYAENFQVFCEHFAKHMKMFLDGPNTSIEQPMLDLRDEPVVEAANTELALAA